MTEECIEAAEKIRNSGFLDAGWYRARYPDIDLLGMDPAEHFVKFGGLLRRDPGPGFSTGFYADTHPDTERLNPLLHHVESVAADGQSSPPEPRYVLWAAARLAARGEQARAITLAERHLPLKWTHTVELLKANAALPDETLWLAHFNAYLRYFDIALIRLSPEAGGLLSRLATDPLPRVETGPLVSVILPAWNAEATIEAAARSILDQTWRPLELIIVDDASSDGTWEAMQALAAGDARVKLHRNTRNVGPYVSKNIALARAKGDYMTGQDADDWSHPQRLADHMTFMLSSRGRIPASLNFMIRMRPWGAFEHFSKTTRYAPDGATRVAAISCLFETGFFRERLGAWDSVRYGADSELIARAERVLGRELVKMRSLAMICLDHENSLTNNSEFGIDRDIGLTGPRLEYRNNWLEWQKCLNPEHARIDFPACHRQFAAPEETLISVSDIMDAVQHHNSEDRS